MADIVDMDGARVAPYIVRAIEGFIGDPPSSAGGFDPQFQRGYLAALLDVYREGLGRGATDARIEAAERILRATEP